MKNPMFAFQGRVAAVLLSTVFSATVALAATQLNGVPNFEKVNADLYRGAQPSSDGFKNLAKLGVKTVIDLREIGEHSQADEEAAVKAAGMSYVSIPLKGMSAPPDVQVAKILAIMNDPSAGPVFVHCRRGADRTGTIVACYRISHDHWENRQALDEARGHGMSVFESAMQHYVMRYSSTRTPIESAVSATSSLR